MGRQQFPRSSIQLPLRHTVLSPPVEHTGIGWTRNLSEGGACMEVAEAVPLHAALRLRFQTDRGAIEAEAVVVWASAPAGDRGPMLHGVAFTRMATDQRQTLRALLQTQARARHTGARFSADLPVAYQALNQAGPPRGGWMENVSRGGMLLNLHELLHPGTRLRVTWQVASEQLTVEGTIVWVEPREGRTPIRHGFRFTALD
jgi:c-di-GMP-binding flagellar brake protein YcgR